MAFRLADVRKTVRKRSDGGLYIHPKLLEGPSVRAQVGLGLSYFHSRLGRARHEFDPEMLVRFFGDPKVARGLVTCLGETYRWRTRDFGEVLTPPEVAALATRGVHTSGDLRLSLFDTLNGEADGYLAAGREDHLNPLARRFRLTAAKLDQLVALDAEENAVLTRIGPVPQPEHVVALYNFQAAATMVRNCAFVELPDLAGSARRELEDACALYAITLTWEGANACLHNQADSFGSYARWGIRLTRALLTAAAAAPNLLRSGRVQVALPGKKAWYLLDRDAARALTAGTGTIYRAAGLPDLRDGWARRRAGEGTAGWRLLGSPEPIVSPAGIVLAPFTCRRDETQVVLWPASTSAALEQARVLAGAGLEVLPLVDQSVLPLLEPAEPFCIPHAAAVVDALSRHWGGPRVQPALQALEGLLTEMETRGFLPESYVAEALGCAGGAELRHRLALCDEARAAFVPGVGLCSPAFVQEMRKGLRRKSRRKPAA